MSWINCKTMRATFLLAVLLFCLGIIMQLPALLLIKPMIIPALASYAGLFAILMSPKIRSIRLRKR